MTLPFSTLDDLIDWFMVNKTLIFRYGSKLIRPSIWIYHNSHHRSTLTESPNNLCRVPTCQQLRVSVALSPPEANYYVWGYLFFPLGLPMLPVTWIQCEWGSEWPQQNTEVCVRLLRALHSLPQCKNRCPRAWDEKPRSFLHCTFYTLVGQYLTTAAVNRSPV